MNCLKGILRHSESINKIIHGTPHIFRVDFLYYIKYNGRDVGGRYEMTKMGRPKDENAKRNLLTLRLTKEIYQKLIEYATKHNMTKTDVALRSLEEFFSRHK